MTTRVYGRIVEPDGDAASLDPADGYVRYAIAEPGVAEGAVRARGGVTVRVTGGVVEDAWLAPGRWRASYTVTGHGSGSILFDVADEPVDLATVAPVATVDGEAIAQGEKGDPGRPGVSVVGSVDQGDGTVRFVLSDGTETDPVTLPPGPAGRGIDSISDPSPEGVVTITYTDGTTQDVRAIRGQDGRGIASITDADSDGTATVIYTDGDTEALPLPPGPKGDPGPASTVPGPAGPPGQVLTPESMLVVGPGRPDAPTTTGMTSAALAALPVGCEYRSTDGAGTGAWVWQKTGPSAWMVTASDAPARRIDFVDGTVVKHFFANNDSHTTIKRVGTDVALSIANLTASGTISAWQKDIPAGFRPSIEVNAPLICGEAAGIMRLLVQTGGKARISGTVTHPLINGLVTWKTSDPWPTTLPGTPA